MINYVKGRRGRITSRVFALYATDLGLISGIPYLPFSTISLIPKFRARSNP